MRFFDFLKGPDINLKAQSDSDFAATHLAHPGKFLLHPFASPRDFPSHVAEHNVRKNKIGHKKHHHGNRNAHFHPVDNRNARPVRLLHKAHVNTVRGRADQGRHTADGGRVR